MPNDNEDDEKDEIGPDSTWKQLVNSTLTGGPGNNQDKISSNLKDLLEKMKQHIPKQNSHEQTSGPPANVNPFLTPPNMHSIDQDELEDDERFELMNLKKPHYVADQIDIIMRKATSWSYKDSLLESLLMKIHENGGIKLLREKIVVNALRRIFGKHQLVAEWFSKLAIKAMLIPTDGSDTKYPNTKCVNPRACEQHIVCSAGRMFVNTELVLNLLEQPLEIVCIPMSKYIFELPMFAEYRDMIKSENGKLHTLNNTRGLTGSGTGHYMGRFYVAIGEENILGLKSTLYRYNIDATSQPPRLVTTDKLIYVHPQYGTVYHELGHAIQEYGILRDDAEIIENSYNHPHRGLLRGLVNSSEDDWDQEDWERPANPAFERLFHGIRNIMPDTNVNVQSRILAAKKAMENAPSEFVGRKHLKMGWRWAGNPGLGGPYGLSHAEISRRKQLHEKSFEQIKDPVIRTIYNQLRIIDALKRVIARTANEKELASKRYFLTMLLEKINRFAHEDPERLKKATMLWDSYSNIEKGAAGCYASTNEKEYFAELCAAYHLDNGAKPKDYVGEEFVRMNEPNPVVGLLERLFARTHKRK